MCLYRKSVLSRLYFFIPTFIILLFLTGLSSLTASWQYFWGHNIYVAPQASLLAGVYCIFLQKRAISCRRYSVFSFFLITINVKHINVDTGSF